MRKITFFYLTSILVLLSSCYNNIIEVSLSVESENHVKELNLETQQSYCFFYNGEKYESDYQINDSTTVIFFDNKVNDIWNTLKNKINLAVFIHDNRDIEYFDNDTILRKKLTKSKTQTRINFEQGYVLNQAYLQYWKDSDFKGTSWNHTLNSQNGWSTAVSSFIGTGLDDRISSYKLIANYSIVDFPTKYSSIIATFYENTNYLGYSFSANVSGVKTEDIKASLKNIFMPNGKNWNDVISSLRFERIEH